jgi:hypothetical protein
MTRPPLFIALCSPAPQMGKSTVAEHLIKAHGFHRLRFAAALKDMLRTLLQRHAGIAEDMVDRYIDGDLKELVIPELGVTARWLAQSLGTEWGRTHIRPDLWVHVTGMAVSRWRAMGRDVVIDDMRFENELQMVRSLGGHCIRIERPGIVYEAKHASEGALNGVQMHTIWNDGTIDQLHLDVDALVASLRGS